MSILNTSIVTKEAAWRQVSYIAHSKDGSKRLAALLKEGSLYRVPTATEYVDLKLKSYSEPPLGVCGNAHNARRLHLEQLWSEGRNLSWVCTPCRNVTIRKLKPCKMMLQWNEDGTWHNMVLRMAFDSSLECSNGIVWIFSLYLCLPRRHRQWQRLAFRVEVSYEPLRQDMSNLKGTCFKHTNSVRRMFLYLRLAYCKRCKLVSLG